MEDFTDLQRLLRLKSHEAPPPDFLEDFLTEFHARQRAEMLKRPLWRLALDRIDGALPNFQFQFPRYAYATACGAALVVAGVSARQILTTGPVPAGMVASAAVPGAADGLAAQKFDGYHVPSPQAIVRSPRFDMYAPRPALSLAELDFDKPRPHTGGSAMAAKNPRYVLDTRPVRYEQPDSF